MDKSYGGVKTTYKVPTPFCLVHAPFDIFKHCEVISLRLEAQVGLFCLALIMTVLLAQSSQVSSLLDCVKINESQDTEIVVLSVAQPSGSSTLFKPFPYFLDILPSPR